MLFAYSFIIISVILLCYVCYKIHSISNMCNKKTIQLLDDDDFLKIFYFLGALIIFLGIRISFFNKNHENLMQTLFSVQATVSTLGIALISILGGVCKDTIFGISITKFITQTRPTILKHKRLLIAELTLIVLGYFALTLSLYNTLIAIFISSIAIIGYMVNDVFGIFRGNRDIEKQIEYYYSDLFKNSNVDERTIDKKLDAIYDISEHIKTSVFENKYVNFAKDLDFIEILFIEHLKNPNISNDEQKDKILSLLQQKIIDTSKEAFNNGNTNFIFKTIDFLTSIHEECNKLNTSEDHYVYLNIYDHIEKELWTSVRKFSSIDCNRLLSELINFKTILYNNIYFYKNNKQKNNLYISIFSSRIYHMLLGSNDDYIDKDDLLFDKKRLFYCLQFDLDNSTIFKSYFKEKKKLMLEELHKYTKTLIDNMEVIVLQKTFFYCIDNYFKNTNYTQYCFNILVYIYYLIEWEDLVGEDEKTRYRNMVKSNMHSIEEFLYFFDDVMDKISIKAMKDKYWTWEKFEESKTAIFHNVIDCFAIYCIVHVCYDLDKMIKYLSKIVQENEMWFAEKYIEENHSNKIPQYKSFVKLFFEESITDEEAKGKIELIEQTLRILYKQKLIKESRDNKLTQQRMKSIELDIKNKVSDEISNMLSSFKNIMPSTKTTKLQLSKNTAAISFKREHWVNKEFLSYVKQWFEKEVVHIIRSEINQENIVLKSQQMLDLFLNKCMNFDIDTILGGKINYYRYSKKDEYLELIKSKKQLKTDNLYNVSVALDIDQCYFEIKNVDVHIRQCDINEFENNYEMINDNEYLCSMINNIKLSFTKEELEEYIHNNKYQITIDIELEYGFNSDDFGVALFANEEEKVIN